MKLRISEEAAVITIEAAASFFITVHNPHSVERYPNLQIGETQSILPFDGVHGYVTKKRDTNGNLYMEECYEYESNKK